MAIWCKAAILLAVDVRHGQEAEEETQQVEGAEGTQASNGRSEIDGIKSSNTNQGEGEAESTEAQYEGDATEARDATKATGPNRGAMVKGILFTDTRRW